MRYFSGEEILAGDFVLSFASPGRVVCDLDHKVGTPNFPISSWEYLGGGVLIEFDDVGLVYVPIPEEDLSLVKRGAS